MTLRISSVNDVINGTPGFAVGQNVKHLLHCIFCLPFTMSNKSSGKQIYVVPVRLSGI